mmetsp:Transcript_131400/g.293994  ORF Transcript_131400/g.293994 Transcript_131400/m.293994 type:complete len:232 (+) Transcript_131400:615-1310(+)
MMVASVTGGNQASLSPDKDRRRATASCNEAPHRPPCTRFCCSRPAVAQPRSHARRIRSWNSPPRCRQPRPRPRVPEALAAGWARLSPPQLALPPWLLAPPAKPQGRPRRRPSRCHQLVRPPPLRPWAPRARCRDPPEPSGPGSSSWPSSALQRLPSPAPRPGRAPASKALGLDHRRRRRRHRPWLPLWPLARRPRKPPVTLLSRCYYKRRRLHPWPTAPARRAWPTAAPGQ